MPTVRDGEDARSNTVDADQAQVVIQWLSNHNYASLGYITWLILADTGTRISIIRHWTSTMIILVRPHVRVRRRPEGLNSTTAVTVSA